MDRQRQSGQSMGTGLTAAWVSDVGAFREKNEDCCLAAPQDGLFVLSDGMGGEPAGGRAAQLVVEWLPDLLADHMAQMGGFSARGAELAIKDAVLELNHRVRRAGSRLGRTGKMGATIVMALARQERVHVAHMGDSRAYLFGGKKLERLTEDHSVVSILLRRGVITAEQATHHPMRGRLSRYVGMGGNARVDVSTVNWRPGDRLLLCTDGLVESLTDEQIQQILAEPQDLVQAAHSLADAAREADGGDDITVLIAEKVA